MKGKTLFTIALFCILALPVPSAGSPETAGPFPLVFSRGDELFLTDTEGNSPALLRKGYDPEISPDGTEVAFTVQTGKDGGGRQIGLYTISTTKSRNYKSVIPGENSYGPRWSPDGTMIVFNHWDPEQSDWVLGLLTLTDGTFRVLAPELKGVYSPFWSADSSSVYCHDLENFFRVSVETGRTAALRRFSEILGEAMPTSAVRFAVSPDGSRWLFDGEVKDTSEWLKSGDGLISALFLHTPADGKTRRVTDNRICAIGPAWLPGGEDFLFYGYTEKEMSGGGSGFAVFRGSLAEGKTNLLVPDGGTPSARLR
ncbi:MAG: PD40 domain-containing protein [Aminivibrio sp.]|nr:PD40 domain-containing protein [Aminivibrio sp.]